MTDPSYATRAAGAPTAVDAGRLWAGGLATAGVAALASMVGFLIARGLFGVPVLAPARDGAWGGVSTPLYALCAGFAALVATGLIHVLLLTTPTPYQFFAWIMGLAIAAGVLAPFMSGATLSAKIVTAVINLTVGVAVWSLVAGVARNAVHRAATRAADVR
jgi:hypothetical protein